MSLLRVNKTKSLSVRLPWLRLLGHLDVRLNSTALPVIVECPLCGEDALQVTPDHLGGEWFSCSACAKAGDAIQLASWVWELSIPGAIKKLSREGFDIPVDRESISHYVDHYVKHRERMNTLWKCSQRNHFHNSTPLRRLVHELRFHSETPDSRWAQGPGQLIGSTGRVPVLTAYYPRAQAKGKNKAGSAKRFFRGRGWNDVLVLPFYDMPGRISGFYFIGRDGEINDRFFRGVNYCSQQSREAGLYLHPNTVVVSDQHWNNVVFAIRDPVMAMQLHARHFETSRLTLPLLAWQEISVNRGDSKFLASDASTEHGWRTVARQQVVFWMPKLDAVVLRQAAAVDGLISMVGPEKHSCNSLQDWVWKRAPADLMRHLAKTARPWVEVFASAVVELNDSLVEQLARQISRSSSDLTQLLNRLPQGPQNRLRALLARTDVCITVPFDREQIIEKNGQWFVAGPARVGEESVLSGILRVDHVIYHARTDASYLEGRLLTGDTVVPFCDAEKTIKKDPLEWVSRLARSKGHVLVEGRRSWSKRLLEIAYAFHSPEFVAGVDTIGWDADNARFVLPGFSIHLGGRVEPALTDLLSVDAPGSQLSPPTKLAVEDFASVASNDQLSKTFWACLTALVANIIAPAFARNPSGIALVGGAAHWTGFELSRAIGCQQRRTWRGHIVTEVEKAYTDEFVHRWPLFVGSYMVPARGKWWSYWANRNDHGYRNCIVAFDEIAGMVKAIQNGWHVVVAGKTFQVPEPWLPLAAKFVPAYLRDLATRNFKLRSTETTPTWLDDVLRDLSDFVEHVGADPAAVRAARELLWPDTEYGHARAFAHVLGLLIRSGKCAVLPEGFQRKDRLQLIRQAGGLFIPDTSLREFLFDKHYLLPEHDVLAKAFAIAGVLVEDQEDGWLVNEQWWKDSQRVEARLLP